VIIACLLISSSNAADCHYNYYGDINENWKQVDCPNSCDNTRFLAQSPVEISADFRDPNMKQLFFSYPNTAVNVRALHTEDIVETGPIWPEVRIFFPADYEGGFYNPMISVSRFKLIQFHFHTPAEHIISVRGKTGKYDAAVHMVHQNIDTKELAVVGLLFKIGAEVGHDSELAREVFEILKSVNTSADELEFKSTFQTHFNFMFNELRDTHEDGYWYLRGSLTAPPCSEGVHWHIMRHEFHMSQEQWDLFHFIVGNNSRPIQRVFEDGHDYVGYYQPPAIKTSTSTSASTSTSTSTSHTTSATTSTTQATSEPVEESSTYVRKAYDVAVAIVSTSAIFIVLIAFSGVLFYCFTKKKTPGAEGSSYI